MEERPYLIVGLGNPGEAYEKTRHNAGFDVVCLLAKSLSITLKKKPSFFGKVGVGSYQGKKVFLLMPTTYMNRSGMAVSLLREMFQIPLERLLIVHDDAALPLGALRLKGKGSAGGHNGLKSVEACLSTSQYPRYRMGIGEPKETALADYVLAPFAKEERELFEVAAKKAVETILLFVAEGLEKAMQKND